MRYYLGVDPGPSTGIALLNLEDDCSPEWTVFQVNADGANWLLAAICRAYNPRSVEYEEFVPSNRAGTKGKAAQVTRRGADQVPLVVKANCVRRVPAVFVIARRATDVFPWASDKRLDKSGFPLGPKFKDARAAGKHALYTAVLDGKERDPLA
jgi:hypothetical protein